MPAECQMTQHFTFSCLPFPRMLFVMCVLCTSTLSKSQPCARNLRSSSKSFVSPHKGRLFTEFLERRGLDGRSGPRCPIAAALRTNQRGVGKRQALTDWASHFIHGETACTASSSCPLLTVLSRFFRLHDYCADG